LYSKRKIFLRKREGILAANSEAGWEIKIMKEQGGANREQ
jgi:hypothetical protein